ncbi:hypothetical protein [Pseudomonas fluorescens]|uniref:Uncharacterized protein n=1 Tax=Pseudomonas fluorescens TaxID=294 RepID=A0A5E7AQA1_PSEFL|nr:hypothetical protein [Pseudomonas fluorescens]VVN80160.1 hypothetical protein PS723_01023 [Pseudomonas fluorescens]
MAYIVETAELFDVLIQVLDTLHQLRRQGAQLFRIQFVERGGRSHAADFANYDPQSKLVIEVTLNTSHGADRGFFRVGYDYSIKRSGDYLHVCFLNAQTKMEAGHFGRYSVGRATNEVLWGR